MRNRVHTALASTGVTVIDHSDPATAAAKAVSEDVDSVLVDMQVASMGAMAVTRAIRGETQDRSPIPVTILLDRKADAFLAKRAGASNWVDKNAEPSILRAAVGAA